MFTTLVFLFFSSLIYLYPKKFEIVGEFCSCLHLLQHIFHKSPFVINVRELQLENKNLLLLMQVTLQRIDLVNVGYHHVLCKSERLRIPVVNVHYFDKQSGVFIIDNAINY
ncbi:Uncharacterised protein [Vibrio cholerae]|uniref:Uncharacterized protein n=1 Tax=Vibrio cholerae TaxID=666 RepID=A0A655X3J5_VIBCL|nr:Uncharacterised protein [Vibrio cholerae]